MKNFRLKHYSYVALASLLLIGSIFSIVSNLRTARAETGEVSITSPTANQELNARAQQITGRAPSFKQVEVFDGNTKISSTTSDVSGNWSVNWANPHPGQHNLRAVVADGTVYRSDPFSRYSVKAVNVNSGQVAQNYEAGFSGSSNVIYDTSENKAYTINYISGTISVINPSTDKVEGTFIYNANPSSVQTVAPYANTNTCTNDGGGLFTVCAYTYNQTTNQLYILDTSRVFVIDLQSRSVVTTIDNVHMNTDDLGNLEYRLYIDPQNQFLYVYHETQSFQGAPANGIQRINLQSNTVDTNWNFSGNAVVSTTNGDVYFAEEGTFNLKHWKASDSSVQDVDITSTGCEDHVTDLAVSSDSNYLYAGCVNTNDQTRKVVAISVVDDQVVTSANKTGRFLTPGNLTGPKLFIATQFDGEIDSFNTQTNTAELVIQGFSGTLQPKSVMQDIPQNRLYFVTTDINGAQSHLYTVNTATGEQSSNTIINDQAYSTSSFVGARSAELASDGKVLVQSYFPNESIQVLHTDNNQISSIDDGLGSAEDTFYSKPNERLFTLPLFSGYGYASQINVASTLTAEYETTIKLPATYLIRSGVMSDDGSTLYVLGADYSSPNSSRQAVVYAINTATLEVVGSYQGLNNTDIQQDNVMGASGRMAVNGSTLVFATPQKLYKLDLQSDAAQVVNLFDGNETSSSSGPLTNRVSVSPDGQTVAVVKNPSTIKMYHTSDLSDVSTIYLGDNPSAAFTTLKFQNNETLLTGRTAFGFGYSTDLTSYSVQTAQQVSTIRLQQPPLGNTNVALCFVSDIILQQATQYAIARNECFGTVDNETITQYTSQVSVLDILSGVSLSEKVLYNSDTIKISDVLGIIGTIATDVNVLSTTQPVTVVADQVKVTSPAQGEKISQGSYTITGTAPPNKVVDVSIDGVSIGSAAADQYGAWQKEHSFTTAKNYTVQAKLTQPPRSRLYISNINIPARSTKIEVYDSTTDQLDDEITLPDNYLSYTQIVSNDNTKLFVLGFNQEGNYRLYTYATLTDQLISTQQIQVPNNSFAPLFTMSDDEKSMYIMLDGTMYKLSISTGQVEQSYPLGTRPQGGGPARIILAEPVHKAIVTYADNTGASIVDLETAEVVQNILPESLVLNSITYSAAQNRIYSIVVYHNGEDAITTIAAIDASSIAADPLWVAHIVFPGGAGGTAANAALSEDEQHLYLLGARSVGDSNTLQAGAFDINTANGAVTERLDHPSSEVLQLISSNTDNSTVSLGMSVDPVTKKLYSTSTSLAGNGGYISAMSLDPIRFDTVITYPGSSLFGAFNNSFIAALPGQVVQDQHTFSVAPIPILPKKKPPSTITKIFNNGTDTTPSTTTTKPKPQAAPASVTTYQKKALDLANKKLLKHSVLNKIATSIKSFSRRVPRAVLNTFPYVLYVMLLTLAGHYLYQTQRQLRREDRLRALSKKQQVISEEKKNFLELTSHYLRTPLTYIKAGAEMITKAQPEAASSTELAQSVQHLSLFIESLVEEAGAETKDVIDEQQIKDRSPILSAEFIVPVALLVVSLSVFYIVFGLIGGIKFGSTRYITQAIVGFFIIQLLYGMLKNRTNVANEQRHLKTTLNSELALDHARSKLMADAGEQLQTRVDYLGVVTTKIENADTSKKIIVQGVERLSELSRAFLLVGQLESSVISTKNVRVSVRDLGAKVIEPFKEQIQEKKLHIQVDGFDEGVTIKTNPAFAELTLKSLIENAIQASKPESSLIIKCLHSDDRVAFKVIDHGEGISQDKITQLFKPFVRVGPVTTFNREGVGLSLFLDRLIMHSLGGEVEIMSKFKHGTVATLTFQQTKA